MFFKKSAWLIAGVLVALVMGLITYRYTQSTVISAMVAVISLVIMLWLHPKRRYWRLGSGIILTVIGIPFLPNFSYQGELMGVAFSYTNTPSSPALLPMLIACAVVLFVLDYFTQEEISKRQIVIKNTGYFLLCVVAIVAILVNSQTNTNDIEHDTVNSNNHSYKPTTGDISLGDNNSGNTVISGNNNTVVIKEDALEKSQTIIALKKQIADLRDYKNLSKEALADREREIARLQDELDKVTKAWKDAMQTLQGKSLQGEPEFYQQAVKYFSEGNINAALNTLSEARIAEQEEAFFQQQKHVTKQADALFNTYTLRAQALTVDGNFAAARAQYQKAVKVFPQNPEAHFNLATFLQEILVEDSEAASAYRQALQLYQLLTDKGNPARHNEDVAATQNNLALLLADNGKPQEAETFYRQALATRQKLAEGNPERYNEDVAATQNNLALLLADNGKPQEAEPFYRQALATLQTLAEGNPVRYNEDVAATQNNLALLLADNGKPQEAEPFYRQALATLQTLAEDNPVRYNAYVAMAQNNLAILLANNGKPREAETFFRQALASYQTLAEGNPVRYNADVAMAQNNLAALLANNGTPKRQRICTERR